MMVHVGYIHTIYSFSKLFTVSHVDTSNSILHKSCLRGGIYFSQKSRLHYNAAESCRNLFFEGLFPRGLIHPCFFVTSKHAHVKVFSVPTTPENDWNLKIQTSPKKEDTLNSNRLKKSPTFTDLRNFDFFTSNPFSTPPLPNRGVSITVG